MKKGHFLDEMERVFKIITFLFREKERGRRNPYFQCFGLKRIDKMKNKDAEIDKFPIRD